MIKRSTRIYRLCFYAIICLCTLGTYIPSLAGAADGIAKYTWESKPFTHNSCCQVDAFLPKPDGFEIYVSKNTGTEFWHIQIKTSNSLPVSKRPYHLSFEAFSTHKFGLYARLGDADYQRGNSFIDRSWEIEEGWKEYDIDFTGNVGKNILYFQLGNAPNGTNFKVKNIRIMPTDQ